LHLIPTEGKNSSFRFVWDCPPTGHFLDLTPAVFFFPGNLLFSSSDLRKDSPGNFLDGDYPMETEVLAPELKTSFSLLLPTRQPADESVPSSSNDLRMCCCVWLVPARYSWSVFLSPLAGFLFCVHHLRTVLAVSPLLLPDRFRFSVAGDPFPTPCFRPEQAASLSVFPVSCVACWGESHPLWRGAR